MRRGYCMYHYCLSCVCLLVALSGDCWSNVKQLLCPARREGGNKRCFCPSVRPSVAYSNNSRIQRHSVPKFGMRVPHLRRDSHTSFKVKRSKVKVTRPINADTHRTARPTNFRLGTRMEDDDPHQPQAHDLQGQGSRSQGHVIWAVLFPMLYLCH